VGDTPEQPGAAHVVHWRSVDDAPADKQLCHIRGDGGTVLMDVPYDAKAQIWWDFFATPEAGHGYGRANGITAWVPASELDFDAGYPE